MNLFKNICTSNFNPGIIMQILKSIKSIIDESDRNGKIL